MRSLLVLSCLLFAAGVNAATPEVSALHKRIEQAAAAFGEPVGVAVRDLETGAVVSARGGERFPMASTFKAFLAIAVFDAADRGTLKLDEPVLVRREDLSLYWQPIAKRVGPQGFRTTLLDLVERAVGESDNAAADILLRRMGGPAAVQRVLAAKGIEGVRIDRQERDFQTAIVGLEWRDEFVDADVFAAAVAAMPAAQRHQAWEAYLRDPRDTATPEGAVRALAALHEGRLLSPGATQQLLAIMTATQTGAKRLKAGLPPGWRLAHKTGSGIDWNGASLSNNDIGIATAPDGRAFAIAVYIPQSRQLAAARDAFIAGVAAAVVASYAPH